MAAFESEHKYRIKKGDNVEIIAGKDKGRQGHVLKILRDKDRVVVEQLNMVKKAQKRRNNQDRGGIVEVEAPIHSSNVMVVCKKCGPVRTTYKVEGTTKTRVCKKCGEAL
jgi:large subunit ribosomal protein L24